MMEIEGYVQGVSVDYDTCYGVFDGERGIDYDHPHYEIAIYIPDCREEITIPCDDITEVAGTCASRIIGGKARVSIVITPPCCTTTG